MTRFKRFRAAGAFAAVIAAVGTPSRAGATSETEAEAPISVPTAELRLVGGTGLGVEAAGSLLNHRLRVDTGLHGWIKGTLAEGAALARLLGPASNALWVRGGFLFHASGLVRHGKAYLFFGPSGSGKTTVTRLSANDLLLNDDCIHITRRNGEFRANGVPFKGRDEGGAENAGDFPIAGLFRLVQSRRVCFEPLSTAAAVSEIVASIPFMSERKEGLERNLAVAEDLSRAVPVGRLQFRLAPDFWNIIEESLRG